MYSSALSNVEIVFRNLPPRWNLWFLWHEKFWRSPPFSPSSSLPRRVLERIWESLLNLFPTCLAALCKSSPNIKVGICKILFIIFLELYPGWDRWPADGPRQVRDSLENIGLARQEICLMLYLFKEDLIKSIKPVWMKYRPRTIIYISPDCWQYKIGSNKAIDTVLAWWSSHC